MTKTIEAQLMVNASADVTFKHFTDVQSYPRFMRSVDQVFADPAHPDRLKFVFSLGGIPRRYSIDTTINTETRTLGWISANGPAHTGTATVRPADDGSCTLSMTVDLDLHAVADRLAQATGLIEGRINADLRRFADYVEAVDHAKPESAEAIAEGEPARRTPLQWLFDAVFPTDETRPTQRS